MTNGGNTGSSSPKNTESPNRRRSGVAINPPPASPPRPWPPLMGIPGVSAFRPYVRPPPPPPPPSTPTWLTSRPSGGAAAGNIFGFGGGLGFNGAQAIPVGGGSSTGGSRAVGGSPSSAVKKRGRDGAAGGGGGGGGGAAAHGEAGGNPVNCSVCGKEFMSPKALFGHMRSHPGRGWKGAHPPPSFKAEEEFADLRGVNLHPAGGAAAAPAPAPAPAAVEDGAGGRDNPATADGEQRAAAEEGGEQQPKYRLPDLNEG